jgi:hypothetical protein
MLCAGFMFGVSSAGEKTTPPSRASALDYEARAVAEQYYAQHLTKCGSDYYVWWQQASGPLWVAQYHGLTVEVKPRALTPIDRWNGVEWEGLITVSAEAGRIYNGKDQKWYHNSPNGWIAGAAAGDLRTSLSKKHGKWAIHALSDGYPFAEDIKPGTDPWTMAMHVDCANIWMVAGKRWHGFPTYLPPQGLAKYNRGVPHSDHAP